MPSQNFQLFLTDQTLFYFALAVFAILVIALGWALSQKNKTQKENQQLQQLHHQQAQAFIKTQADNEHFAEQIQDLLQQKSQLTLNLEKEQQGITALNQQMTQAKGEAEKYKAQAESLTTQLQEKTDVVNDQQAEILNLRSQVATLKTSMEEKAQHFAALQQNANEAKAELTQTFHHLAHQILEEKKKSFESDNKISLETLLNPFKEKIDDFKRTVENANSKQIADNASLSEQIKQMMTLGNTMSQEAMNLTNALKGDKKALGNWGELQLEKALQMAGLEAGIHYQAQEYFMNDEGIKQYPDFVLHLPDEKHIVIDSKMSLVAYEQAVNTDTPESYHLFLKKHCQDLRNHINGLSGKNYSALRGLDSPNFVLMFVALEPAYMEALKNDPSLFEYGYQRNVILVSHTTLMPILRTVSNLWRLEQGNKEAQEISRQAGDLYNQLCTLVERFKKLGDALGTTQSRYNETVVALAGKQGIIGKAERFQKLSNRANKTMTELEPLVPDTEKMALLNLEEK